MDISALRQFALSLPESRESLPFGPETLVFKVRDKIFLLVSLDSDPLQFNVKCDPDVAVVLREEYDCILPGYHMNKKHWNTVIVDGKLRNDLLKRMIIDSYHLVNKSAKRDRPHG